MLELVWVKSLEAGKSKARCCSSSHDGRQKDEHWGRVEAAGLTL